MFRNDRQICEAVRVLLRSIRLEHLWTDFGPTDEALKLLEDRGSPLSHGEAVMVLTAFDFWNGDGKVEFRELLTVLDRERLALVASLMLASSEGSDAVDRWMAQYHARSA